MAGPDDSLADIPAENARWELRCGRTDWGYRYEGEDFEIAVYWQGSDWQTTITSWVQSMPRRSGHSLTRTRVRVVAPADTAGYRAD